MHCLPLLQQPPTGTALGQFWGKLETWALVKRPLRCRLATIDKVKKPASKNTKITGRIVPRAIEFIVNLVTELVKGYLMTLVKSY